MNFSLIYDKAEEKYVEETILPLIKDISSLSIEFSDTISLSDQHYDNLLLYLSDNQIKQLFPQLLNFKGAVYALPHLKAERFCRLTGVDKKTDKAIEHLISEDKKVIDINILFLNNSPVFSDVVVGDSFQLASSKFYNLIGFWKRTKYFLSKIFKLKPFKVKVIQRNGNSLNTAVSGILVSTYKTSSKLSGFIPGELSLNNDMFHALLISPRSIFQLIAYGFNAIIKTNKLPEFGAHIKSDYLVLDGQDQDLIYTLDGDSIASQKIELEVKKSLFKVIPGSSFNPHEKNSESDQIFKTQFLPFGEAALELTSDKLPLIKRASTEEFKDLFQVLRDNAKIKSSFLVLMVLSTALATLGLFGNSSPVVIGAMILAPLMSPIISLSMATLRQDRKLALESALTILVGLGLSFAFAVIITLITPIKIPNQEILARTTPNILDLGVAILSGIAGAYAHARKEIAKTLAGVAIAVALVPPLAVAGIGFGWLNWDVFLGAFLLLLTNLSGMVLAGSITFLALGFSPFRLVTKGILITLFIVGIFSVPLSFGFNKMVLEHKVIQTIDGKQVGDIIIKEVRIQKTKPLIISIKLVTDSYPDDEKLKLIKSNIEQMINEKVELEITISITK